MSTLARSIIVRSAAVRPTLAHSDVHPLRLATLTLAIAISAVPALAQQRSAALAPSTSRDRVSAVAAKNESFPANAEGTTSKGFEEGHLYAGPHIWAGVYGTMAFGVSAEKSLGGPRKDLGNGRIGVGGGVDMYSYGVGYAGYRWSYRVIPVSAFANYHMTLKNARLDPYAGLGVGYYIVSSSVDGPGLGHYDYTARANALFVGAHVGARYFVKPNFAMQAQTGVGLGNLALGVTWKM